MEQEKSILYDAKGHKYELSQWRIKGVKFSDPHDITSPMEFIEGSKGYLIFEIPKAEKPIKLELIYYFKESLDDKPNNKGQIDINTVASEK